MPIDQNTKDLLKKQFATLPKDIQDAMLSSQFGEKLREISKKHELSVGQMNSLENETMFVMLGIERPDNYIKNLEKEVGLPSSKVREVAQEVNEKIFRLIRESLKKIHRVEESEEVKKEAPVQATETPQHRVPSPREATIPTHQQKPLPKKETAHDETLEDRIKRIQESSARHKTTTPKKDTVPLIEHETFHDEKSESGTLPIPEPQLTKTQPLSRKDETEENLVHSQVLKEVEEHANAETPEASVDFVAERLKKPVGTNTKISEHTDIPESEEKKDEEPLVVDPYREPIE